MKKLIAALIAMAFASGVAFAQDKKAEPKKEEAKPAAAAAAKKEEAKPAAKAEVKKAAPAAKEEKKEAPKK